MGEIKSILVWACVLLGLWLIVAGGCRNRFREFEERREQRQDERHERWEEWQRERWRPFDRFRRRQL